jgi:DNA gyrase subunit A
MSDLKPIIETSFTQYSGAVLQSRALIDVRDCLKPSARQIFYCMETDKFTHNKPFKKTLKAIGSASRMYIHGDSSCEGVIMRAGQPFAMRYPLIEVEGSYGNLTKSGNWSAPRYTSARLSEIGDGLFGYIQKNTISEWRDNYDDTEQYPAVLSTPGYYNICNGSFGIGIGMSSSVPQFNLRDINEAMEKLLLNPNISDDEIIPMPDFATGGCLLNPTEVKESLKNGSGKACLLRSVINYDNKENCLVVTEIPYSVYTNTICAELEQILNGDENPGIDRFNDLTGSTPLIKIYLNKNANVNKILQYLYKNTSLQYWYSINLTMLKDGRFPQVFSLREALNEHIEHEKIVYRRAFEYDKAQAEARLHIVEGLLIALANIDEVVYTIKNSSSPSAANIALQSKFLLSETQAKAILDMKLSRLAHLEVEKLENEKIALTNEINRITTILGDITKFNNCLI